MRVYDSISPDFFFRVLPWTTADQQAQSGRCGWLAVMLFVATASSGIAASAPVIHSYTTAVTDPPGGSVTLTVTASGDPAPTLQWQRNGSDIPGAVGSSLVVSGLQPDDTGIYHARVANSAGARTVAAIVALSGNRKVTGSGQEVIPKDIRHPNGNVYDQVMLTGVAESITADPGQATRTSYIDLDGDIVQVEFSGPGTLSLVLDAATGPATPENYHQPAVQYMRGHAGIVITGATELTNVSVFTVGRATAFDPSGTYDLAKPISAENDPDRNRSPLFEGHDATSYDGIADIGFIAIMSANGKFGGLYTGNAHYFAHRGSTGIHAPSVQFVGPVRIGDIVAFDSATPVLLLGSAEDVSVNGGSLDQANDRPVQMSGVERIVFTAGADSGANTLPAQSNRAVLMQNGQDVTSRTVVNP